MKAKDVIAFGLYLACCICVGYFGTQKYGFEKTALTGIGLTTLGVGVGLVQSRSQNYVSKTRKL